MPMKPDPALVADFWDAIAGSSPTFVEDTVGQGPVESAEFAQIAAALQAVDPALLLLVGAPRDARCEVIVSAGGNTDLFPAVIAVVDAAPAHVTDRFTVRAFRPRSPHHEHMRVTYKDRDVGVSDIKWTARQQRRDRTRCDLNLYLPGYLGALPPTSSANSSVIEATFLLLDHAVGEWGVEAQIGQIDWFSIDAAGPDARPMSELPGYLDHISAT